MHNLCAIQRKISAETWNQVSKIEITSSKCNRANIQSIDENKFFVDFQNQFDPSCSSSVCYQILNVLLLL